MSTHSHFCIVCGVGVSCCNDEHALGCGESYCSCDKKHLCIEFCSEKCFHELEQMMQKRWKIYTDLKREYR